MIERDWYGCYSEGWGSRLTSEAFQHPAKVSYGLAVRIIEHMLEQGWLRPGDTVLDPFAGIGGFALPLMAAGCHFVGVELERHFVDMGRGCDCTGMSAADWVRFQGRWELARYSNGRYWCPKCLADAHRVLPSLNGQQTLFGDVETTAYRRNSGRIPHTGPHHYAGNVEVWGAQGLPGTAVIVQGDSRNLCEIVGRTVGGAVASPPFSNDQPCASQTRAIKDYHTFTRGDGTKRDHGMRTPGNLDTMCATDADHQAAVQAAVGSPPYAGGCQHTGGNDPNHEHVQGGTYHGVGMNGAISSAPYAESLSQGNDPEGYDYTRYGGGGQLATSQRYGQSKGQLSAMREGSHEVEVQVCVASPPYEGSMNSGDENTDKRAERADGFTQGMKSFRYGHNPYTFLSKDPSGLSNQERHELATQNPQVGALTGDTFWSAARIILEQTYQLLTPDSYSAWVCKRFVRDHEIVDFSRQWAELCEAVGFETVEWIRAWLVEDRGAQYRLDGELEEREVRRMSFFRRLHVQKYPHLSIDWEDVIIVRKPGGHGG
jgi:hypothetical protein